MIFLILSALLVVFYVTLVGAGAWAYWKTCEKLSLIVGEPLFLTNLGAVIVVYPVYGFAALFSKKMEVQMLDGSIRGILGTPDVVLNDEQKTRLRALQSPEAATE
jgi:hypothetical protein